MCDVMFYLVEPHRTVVFDTVCRQANHAASAWKEANPSNAANIHIIAHSLGEHPNFPTDFLFHPPSQAA
jgi:hypothetical protein